MSGEPRDHRPGDRAAAGAAGLVALVLLLLWGGVRLVAERTRGDLAAREGQLDALIELHRRSGGTLAGDDRELVALEGLFADACLRWTHRGGTAFLTFEYDGGRLHPPLAMKGPR